MLCNFIEFHSNIYFECFTSVETINRHTDNIKYLALYLIVSGNLVLFKNIVRIKKTIKIKFFIVFIIIFFLYILDQKTFNVRISTSKGRPMYQILI